MKIIFILSLGMSTLFTFPTSLPSNVLWPQPRALSPRPDLVLSPMPGVHAPESLVKPAALLRRELKMLQPGDGAPGKDETLITLRMSEKLIRPEGYILEASGRQILIEAVDLQGAFWGVHTLIQLLKWDGAKVTRSGVIYPGVLVRDWPESEHRSFMIQAPYTGSAEELKKTLDLLARFKVRYFALELGPRVILDLDPAMGKVRPPHLHFTKQQAKEMVDYGRSLGLEPIAYLNLLGHLEGAYQKAPYTGHGGIMIQNSEVYEKFVFPVVNEMLEVYGPVKYFHAGMDEAMDLFRYLAGEKFDTADLLAKHITTMNQFFEQKKIQMVIWHDMFLTHDMSNTLGPSIGPANGGAPYLTAAALGKIPKSVIINYWMYQKDWEVFPAIDYFQSNGFSVWASPWYYPFRLTRYAATHRVPTFGTIWAGAPKCFTFSPSDAAMALYATAAWNPGATDTNADGESRVGPDAVLATKRVIFDRATIGVEPGSMTLIRGNGSVRNLVMPEDEGPGVETHFGVPFDFTAPRRYEPLASGGKPLGIDETPVAILINGNEQVGLDGCNAPRAAYQLVLYKMPMGSTKANVWGVEAVVSSNGEVLGVAGRDTGRNFDTAIPPGGFVLSAHGGAGNKMYDKVMSLRNGDRISALGAGGRWLGGATPFRLSLGLPGGKSFLFDGVDGRRGNSNLILYQSGFAKFTGSKNDGVEIAVSNGLVSQVFVGKGNAPIPEGGYVISAQSESAAVPGGLGDLAVGRPVALVARVGEKEHTLSSQGPSTIWEAPLGRTVKRLWFVATTPFRMNGGMVVGTMSVHFRDKTVERMVTRAAYEIVSGTGVDTPASITNGRSWLVQREDQPKQCLVYEWRNPKPGVGVEKVVFRPALAVLQSGLEIHGVTAEIGKD